VIPEHELGPDLDGRYVQVNRVAVTGTPTYKVPFCAADGCAICKGGRRRSNKDRGRAHSSTLSKV
jgi:hypothetical protein